MGFRYQKYRSIAIPLNIGIELSQVSRYFDIFGIEPALIGDNQKFVLCSSRDGMDHSYMVLHTHGLLCINNCVELRQFG